MASSWKKRFKIKYSGRVRSRRKFRYFLKLFIVNNRTETDLCTGTYSKGGTNDLLCPRIQCHVLKLKM